MSDGRDRLDGGRMRAAFFIDDLGPGGTQRWLALLLRGLRERGYESRVFVMRDITEAAFLARVGESAEVTVVGEPALWGGHGWIRIQTALRRWRPHIVQTMLPTSDMIGRISGRLAGVPVVVSSVRGRNADKRAWQRFLDRRTACLADKVIFNADDAVAHSLEHEGIRREQVIHIPNGVERPVGLRRPAEVRAELGIPDGVRVIGMVSRLHPSKGHDDMLSALALLAGDMADAVLVVAGDGVLRGVLEARVRSAGLGSRVRFVGHRNDVADVLGAMDVFAHPSRWEGMPNALMEAMAAGLPVVASRVDGIARLVVDGETGLLTDPARPDQLAVQLGRVLSDAGLARRLGDAAARRMAEEFSLDRMVARYDGVYRDLLREKGGGGR